SGVLRGTTSSLPGSIVNNASVEFDQSVDGVYAGQMSGSGSLTKSGAGTLTLSGLNAYVGGTVVNAGTLAGDTTSIGGNVQNDAIVEFNQNFDGAYVGEMSGSGAPT